jgi:hypothetical protein
MGRGGARGGFFVSRRTDEIREGTTGDDVMSPAQIRALTRTRGRFTPEQRDRHDREFRVITALRAIAEQDCTPAEYIDQLPDYMRPMVGQHFGVARDWLLQFFELWPQ